MKIFVYVPEEYPFSCSKAYLISPVTLNIRAAIQALAEITSTYLSHKPYKYRRLCLADCWDAEMITNRV